MNKVFLLFGAAGNLGRGISKVFFDKDYNKIYLVDVRKFELPAGNTNCEWIESGDLSEEENVKNVFNKIIPEGDTSYFLYSTVGGFLGGKTFWDLKLEELEKMMRLNFTINFLIAKHFSLLVKNSGGGSICFTSAMASFRREEGKGIYSLTKNALNFMVEVLALEGKEINMSVNAIAPNILDTQENRSWVKDLSMLTSPEQIGEFVHNVYSNYKSLSGNIFKIPFTINRDL